MAAAHILPRIATRIALRKTPRQTDILRCCTEVKRCLYTGSFAGDPPRPTGSVLSQNTPGMPHQGRRQMSDIVPDLQRFLLEVGTDPREARYWLKQFTKISTEPTRPFALVYVEDDVFSSVALLDTLASCISFLQRNRMKTVILVGNVARNKEDRDGAVRRRAVANMVELSNKLECNWIGARPLFPGSGVVQVQQQQERSPTSSSSSSASLEVTPALVQCSLLMNSVPILSCFGETAGGQMCALDEDGLILELAKVVRPLKIIHINSHGGFVDEEGQRIANVHLPADLQHLARQPWCQEHVRKKMETMYRLLKHLPAESSAVITSPGKMLAELFSHRDSLVVSNQRSNFKRSGTFFTIIEKINTYDSLDVVDETKLSKLFDSSFQKSLRLDYFNEIRSQVLKIFVSERYNAAAIVLEDKEAGIPYLCKFAVSAKAQGAGTGENLWRMVRKEFQQLFWRSQHNNPINPWYFKQSDGSWTGKQWTVFWYGIEQPAMSARLVESALARPPSFLPPGAKLQAVEEEEVENKTLESPD